MKIRSGYICHMNKNRDTVLAHKDSIGRCKSNKLLGEISRVRKLDLVAMTFRPSLTQASYILILGL